MVSRMPCRCRVSGGRFLTMWLPVGSSSRCGSQQTGEDGTNGSSSDQRVAAAVGALDSPSHRGYRGLRSYHRARLRRTGTSTRSTADLRTNAGYVTTAPTITPAGIRTKSSLRYRRRACGSIGPTCSSSCPPQRAGSSREWTPAVRPSVAADVPERLGALGEVDVMHLRVAARCRPDLRWPVPQPAAKCAGPDPPLRTICAN